MAKVCLIYFDFNTGYYPSFHHDLAYIIGTLKNDNHEVVPCHLINENDLDTTVRILKKEFPEIKGICISEGESSLKDLRKRLDNKEEYLRVMVRKED